MRSLSKEAERKLIGAIEKAAALVNDGTAPTDAIIKSAREHDVPAGHINLMVHAYNTGRTTTQREKGESTLEKAAEFPMADAGDVLKALYPETVKSSAEITRAAVVSTEYALPVAGMLDRRRKEMEKAAAAKISLPEKTWRPPPRDEREAVLRAQSEKIAAQRAEEETRRQATVSYSKAAAALDNLSVYFRTPGNMSFGDALREVNLRLGPSGVSVLEKVAAVYPHFTKQADTKKNHFGENPVYGMVQTVLESVSNYNEAQSRVATKKSEAVCKKTAPEFLTGSILAEAAEEPLLLKEAVPMKPRNRPPGSLTHKDDAPESSGGQIFSEIIPPKDNAESAADYIVKGLGFPSSKKVVDENIAAERDYQAKLDLARSTQEAIDDERQRNDEKYYDENILGGGRVQRELDDVAARKQDEVFERDQAERKEREEELNSVEQIRADKKKHEEAQKKERDDNKKYYSDFGAGIGKAMPFKGDAIGSATAPIKFIGGLLGAKSVADLSPIQKKDPKNVLREQYQRLTDPSHENALNTIRAKSIMHDMVLNDPVISGYDPQDVAMAFNEIAELAPSLVDAPGMIRPLLRKRLESGQLADFDVKQILEMDKLRADRDKAITETKDRTLNLL